VKEAKAAITGANGKVCHILNVKPFAICMTYDDGTYVWIILSSISSHGFVVM
jgi:hypothetical protein